LGYFAATRPDHQQAPSTRSAVVDILGQQRRIIGPAADEHGLKTNSTESFHSPQQALQHVPSTRPALKESTAMAASSTLCQMPGTRRRMVGCRGQWLGSQADLGVASELAAGGINVMPIRALGKHTRPPPKGGGRDWPGLARGEEPVRRRAG